MSDDDFASAELTDSSSKREDARQPREPVVEETAAMIRRRRKIALVLNLIVGPGLGHLLLGRVRRGALWIAGTMALLLLTLVWMPAMWLGMFGTRIGSSIDGYFMRISAAAVKRSRKAPMWLVGFGIYLVVLGLFRVFALEAFKIPSGAMNPTLHIGDHMFVNKLSYRLGDVERGDVVVFVFPCDRGKDFVKRVVALGGDTVEVRCNLLYVNGEQVPQRASGDRCTYWDYDPGISMDWEERECSRYTETMHGASYETIYSPSRPAEDRRREKSGDSTYEHWASRRDFPRGQLPSCPAYGNPTAEGEHAPGSIEASDPGSHSGPCAPRAHFVVPDKHVFVMGDNRENSSDSRVWGAVPVADIKGRAIHIWWSSRPNRAGGVQWDRIGSID